MNKYNVSLKKSYFSSKYASKRADCISDNPEKTFPTKGFLDQSPKKCEILYTFVKIFFPSYFHAYSDCGFRKSGESFR